MSRETLQRIFVPFFTTKDINEGTGLGLPVVHGILVSHGASIDVESECEKGTRFTIRFPLPQPAES
jgi:signal transduction histidine kinase